MFLQTHLVSKKLQENTTVNVILPHDKDGAEPPFKTLWLLHGLGGNQNSWMRMSSIERYAQEYNLAVIMPSVDRSWYTNTAYGTNYFDFITKELPELCHKAFGGLSEKREDNIIAGLSMGGYGAVKTALTYPEKYGACIALSGALDITRKNRSCDIALWRGNFGFELESALDLKGSEHDVFALARKNKSDGKPFPKLFMWCGTEDSLITENDSFDKLLTELDIPHVYKSSEGNHSWKWWDLHIQDGLKYVLDDK
ncbi:MAG: esterase family protein [Clostridia bacterium]|nr:esterase family protein [Clostridia bacterium]